MSKPEQSVNLILHVQFEEGGFARFALWRRAIFAAPV
jgi:hypothetical protein